MSPIRFLFVAVLLATVPATAQDKPSNAELPPIALKTKGFDAKLLEAVDGVTVRDYAHIVFQMFVADGKDAEKIYAERGITKDRFDAITAVMTERFRKDPTFKYSEIYAAYYQEAAGGPFEPYAKDYAQSVLNGGPLKLKEPMSFENYMQLSRFYAEGAMRDKPTTRAGSDKVLASKGITFVDYQVLGAWFGRWLAVQSGR